MTAVDYTWYQKPDGVRERTSAGGIIVRWEGKPLIALVREKNIRDYVLPKGGVEKKESLEIAAAREISEEAGIHELNLIGFLGSRERLNYRKNRWITTHYFLFTTTQVETTPSDFTHFYRADWFPVDDIPPMLWHEQEELIRENRERIWKLFTTPT